MSYDTNLRAAVSEHVNAKGRHHSMLTYQALVVAFNGPKSGYATSPSTDDIVQRLREHNDPRLYREADILMSEAADRIDALTLPTVIDERKPDPHYDARCALQDRTDWSAS